MRNRLDEAKADLLQRAVHSDGRRRPGSRGEPGGHSSLVSLVSRYYRHVAPEDLLDRDPHDVLGAALSHRRLAETRLPGRASVHVFNPSIESHGWTSDHTIVEIVTDDMPFLVDSVTMALTASDRSIHVVVHPQFIVRRDAVGSLLEVSDLREADLVEGSAGSFTGEGQDVVVESWMHIEIGRESDPAELTSIARDVTSVLQDVRQAVEDWPRMTQLARSIADELATSPPPVPAEEVAEARELLTWLADDHFTFLGYREYQLVTADGEDALQSVTGTGLGILRQHRGLSGSFGKLPARVRALARVPRLLVLTKANSRSTVHRPAYLDHIGIKVFGPGGEVVGERRFLGLFTSAAYNESVTRIPVLRRKARMVLEASGLSMNSHSGKDLMEVLETYPRDELYQISVEDLLEFATAVLHLQERRQLRLFVRKDEYGRFLSCLVYLPRDRYNTDARLRIQEILLDATGGASIDYTARISESVLARLHFVVRMPAGSVLPELDVPELEARLAEATRAWTDDFADALVDEMGEESAASALRDYRDAFPEAYKEDFDARTAVADLRRLEALVAANTVEGRVVPDAEEMSVNLYQPFDAAPHERRFKIYRTGSPISLSEVLPILTRMGVEVTDERPYELTTASGHVTWIYDFGLRYQGPAQLAAETKILCEDSFAAVWRGHAESDGFNALVLRAGLSWTEAMVLRAVAKYLRQGGMTFSQEYIEDSLVANPSIARLLVDLFLARFDPDRFAGADDADAERAAAEAAIAVDIESALEAVASLDQDRILRAIFHTVRAMLRTSYFARPLAAPQTGRADVSGAKADSRGPCVAFKLDPALVPDLPAPRPRYEIWVYSPRVEGVHLRFGPVARGGLRWSDRREDFRTEVLGLAKAQAVKNAVIVPVGAKGGFVAKRLPDPSQREAWLAEGVACYQSFVAAMLDVTDNRAPDGSIVPPPRVVRHDGDDPYLVVAADKGTATFSDIANAISLERGFWLGDAFASGGSAGYDHKEMGITARGAWESVKRHFAEMGRSCMAEDFTCVGIGDMSGDVFGNGMLLSPHTRLVAAFDHRHVFLDPDPDPVASLAERRRLFELPRSSWADYDTSLLSPGGGVHPRTAKSIELTPQVRDRLGVSSGVDAMSPAELIRAILLAPVDLLWNGGIGTYVKASTESNADVGDKANDAVRVNGGELRVACVGEGGNLGFTQLGRVEYALAGGRINTDAIDNSAGVDTSDHEVNIKIVLDRLVRQGELTPEGRVDLLERMTDDVAALVLSDNYAQNLALANALAQAPSLLHVHQSYIASLKARGLLDPRLEFLPTEREVADRRQRGAGLTAPELSVLLAYTKLTLSAELLETSLPDDPYLAEVLLAYFPRLLHETYPQAGHAHPLRREIITTAVVNHMVNEAGITFVYRLGMETGASADDLARAHLVASGIFEAPALVRAIESCDPPVSAATRTLMRLDVRTLVERAVRWLVGHRRPPLDMGWQLGFFGPTVARVMAELPSLLRGRDLAMFEARRDELASAGAPEALATAVAATASAYALLGVVETSVVSGHDPLEVARVHFVLGERLDLGPLLERIVALPRSDRWQTMARAALRDDLHSVHAQLTAQVLASTPESQDAQARVAAWESQGEVLIGRARSSLREILEGDTFDISRMSVGLRVVRALLRSGADSPAPPL